MAYKWIDHLAYSLGRSDEAPNMTVAETIAGSKDNSAVSEMIALLAHMKTGIRSNAIKVLYEVGERDASLITPHVLDFILLLVHKDNRMRWGAMSALAVISDVKPALLADHLAKVVAAMDSGTVITRDHGMTILANVAKLKKHHSDCMALMLEQIEKAPVNQVNQYAEKMAAVISAPYVQPLIRLIDSREDVKEFPPKKKRIEKLILQLSG